MDSKRAVLTIGGNSFQNPTKPMGSFMTAQEAFANEREFDWQIMENASRGFRGVVPAPFPREIIELDADRSRVDHGHIVIAGGKGGVPMVRHEHGGTKSPLTKTSLHLVLREATDRKLQTVLPLTSRASLRASQDIHVQIQNVRLTFEAFFALFVEVQKK